MSTRKEDIIALYSELAKKLGKMPSWSDCRRYGISQKMIEYHFGGTTELKEAALEVSPELASLSVPSKLALSDIHALRLDDDIKDSKKYSKEIVKAASVLEYLDQFAETVYSGKIVAVPYPKRPKPTSRIHTLVLSDLHFGSDISGEETTNSDYGRTEEARRFAAIVRGAATYKEQYRDHTMLKILLLGDIIENAMHDARTGAPLAEQMSRAIHLICQGIAHLSSKYPKIEVECATGNHGRNTARHKQRAVHQKWDSLETIIYSAVKEKCSELKNVKVFIPKSPIGSYEVFGKRIAYTHGDTVLSPGNPGSKLDTKSLENQVNRINASLADKDEYAAFVYGHTHVPHLVYLNNGCILVGNGSLPPPDDFAVSIGILESNNGQWIFESVEGHPVGDLRLLKAGANYDKDKSLDSIIKPWSGF